MTTPKNNTNPAKIGARIRAMREATVKRQEAVKKPIPGKAAFAKLILGSKATARELDAIEAGEKALPESCLKRVAEALQVPYQWLTTGHASFQANDIIRLPGVGRRITEARMSKGLTYIELSRRVQLGETSRNVARLEDHVHCPKLSTIERIAEACAVPSSYILFG